jgi:hypothetical protein
VEEVLAELRVVRREVRILDPRDLVVPDRRHPGYARRLRGGVVEAEPTLDDGGWSPVALEHQVAGVDDELRTERGDLCESGLDGLLHATERAARPAELVPIGTDHRRVRELFSKSARIELASEGLGDLRA